MPETNIERHMFFPPARIASGTRGLCYREGIGIDSDADSGDSKTLNYRKRR
jgi:hypothetical protein